MASGLHNRTHSPLSTKLPFECPIGLQASVKDSKQDESVSSRNEMRRQHGIRKGKFEAKNIVIKEGDLFKHSKTALKKGTYRHFKLYREALFYSRLKDETQDNLINIVGASIAERGTKNTSHTFSVITETRTLILSAESRREMEDWMRKMRSCAEMRIDKTDLYNTQTLSGLHNWCIATNNRPAFCNKCRDVLSGANYRCVTCEVCGIKAHQYCANGITEACKWTTLESMVRDGVKFKDKSLHQPHQWLEGNLPSNSKCISCNKQCGSKKALSDWSCIWCRQCCHESCKAQITESCKLGKHEQLILPAKAAGEDTSVLNWNITDTSFSYYPFLSFVNSRSGDNQGVKFVRRLRTLLNPLQVIDLGVTTPEPALEVYKACESFQILACGGDGTVGWILQCLDNLDLHKKASTVVVPLGTGNDLSRVLGWGAACNDDAKLDGILDDIQKCIVKQLDRWSVSQYPLLIKPLRQKTIGSVSTSSMPRKMPQIGEVIEDVEEVLEHKPKGKSERRSSSTGDADLSKLDAFMSIKRCISLPNGIDIDIPTTMKGHVTFGFDDSTTEADFSESFDDREFTAIDNSLAPSLKSEKENESGIEEILGNLLQQLFNDILKNYPKPGKIDLAIAKRLCILLKEWFTNFLLTMEQHMERDEMEVSIIASKASIVQTELTVLINLISRAKGSKYKSITPESELLTRCDCFLLIAHNATLSHLEGEGKSEFISLILGLLLKATQATEMENSRKMILTKYKEFEKEALIPTRLYESKKRVSIFQEIKDIATMNNYIGIGLDAKIALDFHNLREEHPEQCKTRAQNKMWYGVFTGRQMVSNEFKTISQRLTLECDGEEIELPQLQGIVVLNIPSYMAGTNFWGTDKEAEGFSAPAIDDRKLEVIAVMGTSHMAESKMFGIQRHRLAQAETVKLTIRGSRKIPMQVDGEAWLQDPGVIIVRHKNKARMLVRSKKTKIMELSHPRAISRIKSSPEHQCEEKQFSVNITNFEISDLVEAVERLLQTIKNICQSKKSEFQESVDKDIIVVYQQMSFTFLQAYGPDGQVIVQGMHHVRDELINSAKTLMKETMLYLALKDMAAENKELIQDALDLVTNKFKVLMT
ncbi:Diacylglycerol kinase delta-like [Oopsacas minuta]|uniref:Diacylglycerol kinase n=1 Tax=Oopsacas minuta TaxID=111878 RepID=A0AAV7K799_9METZ|nr:Diacylglycerol kinase delta-like [Oopsacas minuta]